MIINILINFLIISTFELLLLNANKRNIVQIASFSYSYNEHNYNWDRIFM